MTVITDAIIEAATNAAVLGGLYVIVVSVLWAGGYQFDHNSRKRGWGRK